MQRRSGNLVTNNLNVGALLFEHLPSLRPDGLPKRVILIYEVHLLDVRTVFDEGRERLHLDVGIRVPTEMPKIALVVGQHGVDGGIIEIENLLVGIAVIVLDREFGERRRY